ncbi:hypothetical protein FHETE_6307 [Fusarium heterosporum]|uniref:Uncharacterized protein n=1 Tax=Fusarium heterosporum TaxID=42747 RepID=A0A8H5WQD9_FUSHE|nr:hypothetical protein FHETE_6307 [Fusarium heterosporum]
MSSNKAPKDDVEAKPACHPRACAIQSTIHTQATGKKAKQKLFDKRIANVHCRKIVSQATVTTRQNARQLSNSSTNAAKPFTNAMEKMRLL